MALRAWVIGLVLGGVACSGATESSGDDSGDDGSSGGTSSGGSSSSSTASDSGASSSTGSSDGGASSSTGTAVTSGAGGNSQTASTDGATTSFGGTSNHDQPDCDTYFDDLDRSCQSAADCALVEHQTDCCGSILVMGIALSAAPDFAAVEQYCAAQFPACGCAARGLELEDGTLIDFGSDDYAAECIEGKCRSHSLAPTSACGPELRCTATQYCHEVTGGPAGSEPSYACQPLGDCEDCECLEVVGCECTQTDAGIKVYCAAP